jgi:hypothetical protein
MLTTYCTRRLRPTDTDRVRLSAASFDKLEHAGFFAWVAETAVGRYGVSQEEVDDAIGREEPSHLLDFSLENRSYIEKLDGYRTGLTLMPPSAVSLIVRLARCGRISRIMVAWRQYRWYQASLATQVPSISGLGVFVNTEVDQTVESIMLSLGLSSIA